MTDEHIMYILINTDLKMSRGKIIAQACHVAVKCAMACEKHNPATYPKWHNGSHTKVVLGCDGNTMRKLKEKYIFHCHWVHDEGRTQIASGSLTAIAFNLMTKAEAYPELKELKLL